MERGWYSQDEVQIEALVSQGLLGPSLDWHNSHSLSIVSVEEPTKGIYHTT